MKITKIDKNQNKFVEKAIQKLVLSMFTFFHTIEYNGNTKFKGTPNFGVHIKICMSKNLMLSHSTGMQNFRFDEQCLSKST